MSKELIKQHAKSAEFITTGLLKNYQLSFKSLDGIRSFATIDKKRKSYVPFVIYKISQQDLKELDIYEELDTKLYYRKRIFVYINKRIYFPVVYIMNNQAKCQIPTQEYLNKIYKGYKEYNLDTNYIEKNIKKI